MPNSMKLAGAAGKSMSPENSEAIGEAVPFAI